MSLLKVDNIVKSYGNHKVLKGITFEINEPNILALVGPNGSGKTTLLNVMTNLLKADSGTVELLGMKNSDPNVFKKVAYLKDNTVLYPYLSGYDHLKYIQSMQKLPKERIDEVVNQIGISEYVRNKTSTYSLGMKQHLLIAMSIMNHPEVLLLDEPLTGLDPTSVMDVRLLLNTLSKKGVTILLSSHSLSEIDFITSNILFLKDGEVIEEDISEYQKTRYQLKVATNDLERVIPLTNTHKHLLMEENYLIYTSSEPNLQWLINTLQEHNIVVEDMSKRVVGAQERYEAIFKEIEV
ncbi:MAG: ABC transporter ATP-binding protein [Erysipelothrix sp.]|nr:ABC transporter ATP-binding protein [Erysipelothrix sp.]